MFANKVKSEMIESHASLVKRNFGDCIIQDGLAISMVRVCSTI